RSDRARGLSFLGKSFPSQRRNLIAIGRAIPARRGRLGPSPRFSAARKSWFQARSRKAPINRFHPARCCEACRGMGGLFPRESKLSARSPHAGRNAVVPVDTCAVTSWLGGKLR